MNNEDWTIKEFAAIAGISRQRLYKLWQADKGPPRTAATIGQRHRVTIPRRGGEVWLFHHKPDRYRRLFGAEEFVRIARPQPVETRA